MSSRAAAFLAWSVWGLSVVLVALSMILSWALSARSGMTSGSVDVALLAFPTVGALIATRRPGNPIGWLLCAVGLALATTTFANGYVAYTLAGSRGAPGTKWIAWVGSWIWLLGVGTVLTFLLSLFPSGRLPSPRWRPVGWLAVTGMATVAFGVAFTPGPLADFPAVRNPLGLGALEGSFLEGGGVGWGLFLASIVLSAASLVARFRRVVGIERQQIKWLAFAGALMAVAWIFGFVYGSRGLPPLAVQLVLTASLVAMPTAIGIAILKYRLYDIDVLINRTLVYGSLTAMLVALYFGGVVALQYGFHALTGQESQLAIVASTLTIAALFNPLRRRVQAFVDRRFYRRKYDARKTLETFSAKLRDETYLDALNEELVSVVRETMQPTHVSLWLRPDTPPKDAQADR
ncbi:MAG TPA: hypothetical protein VFE21_04440 [Rubrobacteraceae bacterium]|nr:hypothetical protein [Rubrobacteraceae bacterium]